MYAEELNSDAVAVQHVRKGLEKAGAPQGLVQCIKQTSHAKTSELMAHCKAFKVYLQDPRGENLDFLIAQNHKFESKADDIRSQMNIIDTNESHCDHIERRIIIRVFDSDIDPFLKLQVKELVIEIGNFSDQADRVSRHINIISMKRRV